VNRISDVVQPWASKLAITPEKRREELRLLLKHPILRSFAQKHPEIGIEQYERFVNQLHHLILERENCARCPGLDQCPNLLKGHSPSLEAYAGMLEIRMRPCSKQLAYERQRKQKEMIKSLYIPKEILEASFETIEPDAGRIEVIEAAIDFCTQFAKGIPRKGLYLYGPLGVGKTRIAGAITRKLVEYNIDSFMVYVPEFMREIQDSIESRTLQEKLDLFKKVTVLILDDIGAEYLTPWKRDEVLGAILQYRTAEHLPTIYTSNFDLDELEEHFANTRGGRDEMKARRIMERIRHYVIPLFVNGPNRRKQYG
jgi:primosomal protein DnaI